MLYKLITMDSILKSFFLLPGILLFQVVCGNSCSSPKSKQVISATHKSSDTIKPPYEDYASTLVVKGIMDVEGTALEKVEPLQIKDYQVAQVMPKIAAGLFEVRLEYENGFVQTVFFDALIASDSEEIKHGFFEIQVPVYGSLRGVKILSAKTQKIFHEFVKDEVPN
jgi:hypothetical protein